MADPKDKASAAPEPNKPGTKSAAVKPPVLEGTARPADPPKPLPDPKPAADANTDSVKAEPPNPDAKAKSDAPRPAASKPEFSKPASTVTPPPVARQKSESHAGAAWLAGLVGGVVGLGAAYGLALLGYWPSQPPTTPPEDPRIASVAASVPELQTVTGTLQDELATLTSRVASIESGNATAAAAAPSTPAANDQLAGDVAALSARIDELAGAPQEARDASAANAAAMAKLEAELAALRQSAAATQAELSTVSGQVATLQTDVSQGSAVEEGQARLPLIVSGFETAFSTGAPYDTEVTALKQALPDFAVPQSVAAQAMTGLKRPDLIARDFNAVLPDILAGRPVSPDASWQETTSDWFRGILALRPTEAVEGDGPEAVVARLEGAIDRGDFAAAKTELDALPQAMRTAVGTVANDIANQAAAQEFLTQLRQAALAQGSGA
ncbi:hypothetical protein VW35_10185 [Devosia soli]|uniref:Mitochondrial inner membrane protein n=1 Tax=Devosia soli TaxID=361041 RepID=A0A0F5LB60_9HYPH|nr:hypothetical protein [Devosia soli]KKB78852.1 hypothetical protein VW35_10185 [Devosia soli]